MKRTIRIKGNVCDICGCCYDPLATNDYQERRRINGEKILSIRMVPSVFYPFIDGWELFIRRRRICAKCSYEFYQMYQEWRRAAEKRGEEERSRLKAKVELDLMEGEKE